MRATALLVGWIWISGGVVVADTFDMVPHSQNALAKGVYSCETRDGVSVNDDGFLLRDHWANWFIADYEAFSFDASTGVFTGKKQTLNWVVLRPGSSSMDLIAHLPGPDTSFNMIRLEVWNDPIRFVMTNGKAFYSGVCELQ